ncbi:MAG: PQQ-binding-like beta-propeller repeat protein [bacterium]|nr:PQQ-binding-like beta-propeller repeat protein [bacterium]
MRSRIAVWCLLLAVSIPVSAGDWPQWRGQRRDGRSTDTGLLRQWPEAGPPLEWSAAGLGAGYSSVAVAGKRIYTLGDIEGAQYALALEREGGKLVWKTRIGPDWKDSYPGPRSTPTVDGDRVFVLGTEGDLCALDAKSGKVVWKRNLAADFGGKLMKARGTYEWKFSESPLVDGDRVIVTPGSNEAVLVALNRSDGKELWRTKLPELGERGLEGAGYSSAVVAEVDGVRQIVQLVGKGAIGVEARTGRYLWGYNRVANDVANVATPVIDGQRVFVSTGYGTGSALIELSATDGGVKAREAYFLAPDTMQNHHGGMVLDGGHVYSGTGHNKGFPLAVRLSDGKVAWGPVRNDGKGSAAVSWADGMLYYRYQDGRMVLVEATAEAYHERGSFLIPGVEQFSWAHPVVAGGRLYLREQDRLLVYDVRRREPGTGDRDTTNTRD